MGYRVTSESQAKLSLRSVSLCGTVAVSVGGPDNIVGSALAGLLASSSGWAALHSDGACTTARGNSMFGLKPAVIGVSDPGFESQALSGALSLESWLALPSATRWGSVDGL